MRKAIAGASIVLSLFANNSFAQMNLSKFQNKAPIAEKAIQSNYFSPMAVDSSLASSIQSAFLEEVKSIRDSAGLSIFPKLDSRLTALAADYANLLLEAPEDSTGHNFKGTLVPRLTAASETHSGVQELIYMGPFFADSADFKEMALQEARKAAQGFLAKVKTGHSQSLLRKTMGSNYCGGVGVSLQEYRSNGEHVYYRLNLVYIHGEKK